MTITYHTYAKIFRDEIECLRFLQNNPREWVWGVCEETLGAVIGVGMKEDGPCADNGSFSHM